MCSQGYAGSIGEEAPLSIGMMPEGFKGVIKRQCIRSSIKVESAQDADDDQKPVLKLSDEKPVQPATPQHKPLFRFGWFPPGLGLPDYASHNNLSFLAHIVRIRMTRRKHFKCELDKTFSRKVTCLSRQRIKQRQDPPSV